MSRFTRVLPGTAFLLAAVLAVSCGPKPAAIRLKESKVKVFGLHRTAAVIGDVVDKNGAIVPGKPISWESSNPKVATIDPQTGSVKTVAAGRTVITARLGDPPLEAKATLEVFDVAV